MKNISTLLVIMYAGLMFSQNKQLLSGFSEIPQSTLINPAYKPDNKFFVGVPLLSQIHISAGLTGASVYDVFADDGGDINDRLEVVINKLNKNNFGVFNQQLEIFSGGFAFGNGFQKRNYLTFGVYQETDVFAYYPEDYVALAYEGNANNIGRRFDLGQLKVKGEVLSVFHLGLSRKVNNKLTLGARGKIYSSVFNFKTTNSKGSFTTVANNQDTFYNHIFDLDLQLQTSGLAYFRDNSNLDRKEYTKTVAKRMIFGGNLGLGIDIGATYQLNNQTLIEASLQDIGFIYHTKDVRNYKVDGEYTFSGVNPLFPQVNSGPATQGYWSDIADNFENLFTIDSTSSKYIDFRPIKLNAAYRHSFGVKEDQACDCKPGEEGYLNQIGVQLFVATRPRLPQVALTAYYYRRLAKWLRLKGAYTIDSHTFSNLGLGMSAHLGSANFYLLADNLLSYQNLANSRSVSLQFGFNFIFKNEKN